MDKELKLVEKILLYWIGLPVALAGFLIQAYFDYINPFVSAIIGFISSIVLMSIFYVPISLILSVLRIPYALEKIVEIQHNSVSRQNEILEEQNKILVKLLENQKKAD